MEALPSFARSFVLELPTNAKLSAGSKTTFITASDEDDTGSHLQRAASELDPMTDESSIDRSAQSNKNDDESDEDQDPQYVSNEQHDEDLDGDNTLHASNVLESFDFDSFFAEAHPFNVQAPAPEE